MLSNEEKIELMKNAYINNYKGSFTQLFMENDPAGDDPELQMQAPQEAFSPNPQPYTAMSPRSTEPENFSPESQRLVQSYKSSAPGETPMGESVTGVVDAPLEYSKGGLRLSEELELPYDSTSNTSAYIKNYTNNYK